jgi:hypothetical protein
MANTPRKRSLNFSKEEELLLLEEVEKFKKIVECKITNRVTCTEKVGRIGNIFEHYDC